MTGSARSFARDVLPQVEAQLGVRFADPALVRQALTHRSAGGTHNERLEFLGDAVLGAAVAAMLYERFPAASEGDLSRARARLVRQETLAALARRMGIPDWLVLGEAERRGNGHQRPSILADAFEALVGAMFLAAGFDRTAAFVRQCLDAELAALGDLKALKDPKTALQEWLQGRGEALPQYELVGTSGPAHAQRFRVRVSLPQRGLSAEGQGTSRRAAEQAAAADVLAQLQSQEKDKRR